MRNISGCPVAGKAEEYVESRELLDEIQAGIRGDDTLCNMPRKFNISVSGCRQGCAQDSINDIGLEPAHTFVDGEEVKGFNVRVGGGLGGREPRPARSLDMFVRRDQAYETVRTFVELYHEEGDRQNRSKNRARFFVDGDRGPKIREEMVERLSLRARPRRDELPRRVHVQRRQARRSRRPRPRRRLRPAKRPELRRALGARRTHARRGRHRTGRPG